MCEIKGRRKTNKLLNRTYERQANIWNKKKACELCWHGKKTIKHIATLECLNKKHVHFDKGLDFLKFSKGNRGQNEEHQRRNKENQRKVDKNNRNRESNFFFKRSLCKKRYWWRDAFSRLAFVAFRPLAVGILYKTSGRRIRGSQGLRKTKNN